MVHVYAHHDELLRAWREAGSAGLRVAHVDFHDDLRGLLVDRRRGRAWPLPSLGEADAGNFLAHAVVERRVTRVVWVHGAVGGRAWDMGIVRYESDLFAQHRRLLLALRRVPGIPLGFVERTIDAWDGPEPDEQLSIDWDCFAATALPEAGLAGRVEGFLERLGDRRPVACHLVYSPEYCHPSFEAFRDLAGRLGERFSWPVRWVSPGLREGRYRPTGSSGDLPRDPLRRVVSFLRRRGIF